MTSIRIVYDPFRNKTRIACDGREITSLDNKINSYVLSEGFYNVLLPFRKRYSVWNGLLPELINEVNDDELSITFEGRQEDFEKLEKAFEECRDMVENIGYSNSWTLYCEKGFENENIIDELINAAGNLKGLCETRAELGELRQFSECAKDMDISECRDRLMLLIGEHIGKWETSGEKYRDSKISELKMIRENVMKIPGIPKGAIKHE